MCRPSLSLTSTSTLWASWLTVKWHEADVEEGEWFRSGIWTQWSHLAILSRPEASVQHNLQTSFWPIPAPLGASALCPLDHIIGRRRSTKQVSEADGHAPHNTVLHPRLCCSLFSTSVGSQNYMSTYGKQRYSENRIKDNSETKFITPCLPISSLSRRTLQWRPKHWTVRSSITPLLVWRQRRRRQLSSATRSSAICARWGLPSNESLLPQVLFQVPFGTWIGTWERGQRFATLLHFAASTE